MYEWCVVLDIDPAASNATCVRAQRLQVEDLARLSIKNKPVYVGVDDAEQESTVDGLDQVTFHTGRRDAVYSMYYRSIALFDIYTVVDGPAYILHMCRRTSLSPKVWCAISWLSRRCACWGHLFTRSTLQCRFCKLHSMHSTIAVATSLGLLSERLWPCFYHYVRQVTQTLASRA